MGKMVQGDRPPRRPVNESEARPGRGLNAVPLNIYGGAKMEKLNCALFIKVEMCE